MTDERDWTVGPCEFATGEVRLSPAPVVELCGLPGTVRKGVMWCEVYACDACYARWRGRRSRVDGDEDAR